MPTSLSWSILDLPETSRTGAELAKERNEPRLRFAAHWGEADCRPPHHHGSASMKPLPAMISELRRKPRYVLINRAPLVKGPAFATVQDAIGYRLACFRYNRDDLIQMRLAWRFTVINKLLPFCTQCGVLVGICTPIPGASVN